MRPPKPSVEPEARHLHDAWATSVYSGLCFDERKWQLPVEAGASRPRPGAFGSPGFQRYPLRVKQVPNRTAALEEARRPPRCWRPGATFVADLRHAGGPTMGIAHFAKRILRLHGLQRRAAELGLPPVVRVAFPATSAAHLAHPWPAAMLRLVAPAAEMLSAEALGAAPCCFETTLVSAREDTYFAERADADALRSAAYAAARLPAARDPCAPVSACYFQRSEGSPGGRWEGGSRLIANRAGLLRRMELLVAERAIAAGAAGPGGAVRVVQANSTHGFEQQVATFAACDLLASVHGSHNANGIFMRPGAAFMELNPHKVGVLIYKRAC